MAAPVDQKGRGLLAAQQMGGADKGAQALQEVVLAHRLGRVRFVLVSVAGDQAAVDPDPSRARSGAIVSLVTSPFQTSSHSDSATAASDATGAAAASAPKK